MSRTPRTDAIRHEPADVLFAHACQLERELGRALEKYANECEASMLAGSQLSALRLQLKEAEERASYWAKRASRAD